jgi:hypothetical protein
MLHSEVAAAVTEYLLAVYGSDWARAKSLAVDAANLESPGGSNLADFVLELAKRFASVIRQEADMEDVDVVDLLDSFDEAVESQGPGDLPNEYRVGREVFALVRAMASDDQLNATLILGKYDDYSEIGDLMMGLATGTLRRAADVAERKGADVEDIVMHLNA